MSPWPKLNFEAWSKSSYLVHRWLQVVGKYRLAATPWVNHSWHATFYVTPHGLTTGPIHVDDEAIEWRFDFQRHLLVGTSSAVDSPVEWVLRDGSVRDFHAGFRNVAEQLKAPVSFHGGPNEVPDPIRFEDDTDEYAYDRREVEALHRAWIDIDRVFRHFRTGYLGKVSPVHLFWGSFDLAVTRFSGREAPIHPGGFPSLPDSVTRDAYSHEVSSAGFWAGGGGIDEACFYCYAYPTPDGFGDAPVEPTAAYFHQELGEFVLTYDAVRSSQNPDETLLAFLQSTWRAAAERGAWSIDTLECETGGLGLPPAHHQG